MALLDDVKSTLESAAVVGGVTGWTLALGYMPPDPDKLVFVGKTTGEAPEVDPDATNQYDFDSFSVVVRGAEYDYEDAQTKADAIFVALHNASINGFVYVFAKHTPTSLGIDDNKRPMLSLNFQSMRVR